MWCLTKVSTNILALITTQSLCLHTYLNWKWKETHKGQIYTRCFQGFDAQSSLCSFHFCRATRYAFYHNFGITPRVFYFLKSETNLFPLKNKQTAPSTVLVSNASLTCVCLFSQEYFYMSLCIFHFECLYHSQTSMLSFFATTRRNCLHTHILRKISVLLSQILELLVESHYESLQSYEKTWRRNIWVSE